MPIIILPRLFMSLLSWVVLGAAAYLLWTWYQGYDVLDAKGVVHHLPGDRWRLLTGVGSGAVSFFGRFLVLMLLPAGRDEPVERRAPGQTVTAPDGSVIHMEVSGLEGAPTLVLTHGWGLASTAWYYARRDLEKRFRLVTWDLPGLGRSQPPKDGRLTIDRFAEALGAVVAATGSGPIILVGHSIGGMTTQTFWRACAPALRQRVRGLVLVDTTHRNPIDTMWLSPLWRVLRWPLIEPMMWLTIAFSPLVWLSSWQGYLSGSNQIAMRLTGFGRYATRGQVDMTARLACKGSPAIQAKGNLAMFRWSVTDLLPAIDVPMLVLAGLKDIVTLPSASELIADVAPRARLVRVEGAGHMGFLERAEVYNEAIATFADELFAPAASANPARAAAGR